MQIMIENVLAGFIANLLFLILTIAIGYLFYLIFLRKSLYCFWGIKDVRKIRVYTSHLRVVLGHPECPEGRIGGALAPDGKLRSFQGSVVTQLETFNAALICNLFYASIPGKAIQPEWLKRILITNVDSEIASSSIQGTTIEPEGTIVAIGSPGYNNVSKYIELELHCPVHFVDDNKNIQLPGGLKIDNTRQGVIVRLKHSERYFFYAAGISEAGTAAATYFLANSWKKLHKKYKKIDSFFAVVQFTVEDYRMSRVITEGQLTET